MYICPKCNREFTKKNIFGNHLTRLHRKEFKTELNYLKFFIATLYDITHHKLKLIRSKYKGGCSILTLCKEYSIDNRILKKYFIECGINIRSHRESKLTENYKEKYTKTCIEKYGVDNVSKIAWVKNKKKETCFKNNGYYYTFDIKERRDKAHSLIDYEKCYKNHLATIYKKYNVTNISLIEDVILKSKASKKRYWATKSEEEKRALTEKARKSVNYESKIQLRVQRLIEELNIEYLSNVFLYMYNFDFMFHGKILLEIQGDFWHASPRLYQENDIMLGNLTARDIRNKDSMKKELIENKGYKVYYLWEYQIKQMKDRHIRRYLLSILGG